MTFLARIWNREPKSLKGIRERSAVVRSAELGSIPFPPGYEFTHEEVRAALERSRARRAAANGGD
jgi:hypothetical protein